MFAGVGSAGAGGAPLRSVRCTPPGSRPVPVNVEDDSGPIWTANDADGLVTSGSDIDDVSSSFSSLVADPSTEYVHAYWGQTSRGRPVSFPLPY